MHARLSEPLTEWYAVLDQLDPGRVIDGFPSEVDKATLALPRPDHHDSELLKRASGRAARAVIRYTI